MSLETELTAARDSPTNFKFDGRLDPILGTSTAIHVFEDFQMRLNGTIE